MVFTEQPRSPGTDSQQTRTSSLVLNRPSQFPLSEEEVKALKPKTPNEWFSYRYPEEAKTYGSPFLELVTTDVYQFSNTSPISLNHDFFAAILGGDRKFGHHVVYYLPELQFYYFDPLEQAFKVTTPEKLQSLLRSWLIRCAEGLPKDVHILNLFQEFRSDSTMKVIVQRAKSILAADESFFSPESKHVRKEGPELPERLARVMVESMLERKEGAILTVTNAYNLFCRLSEQRNLNPIARTPFKELMVDLMKDMFGVGIRRDLPNDQNKQQEGWKGVGTAVGEALAA